MRIRVEHRTRYRFTAPVFLEPHTLRFRPRSNSWQRLDRFDLTIDPAPAGLAANLDLDGNDVLVAWFHGLTATVTIDVRFEVETLRTNPFDFLPLSESSLSPSSLSESALPATYAASLRPLLAPYLGHEPNATLRDYARGIAEVASSDAPSFASRLAHRLHEECRHVTRPEGPARAAEETLRRGEGACRDLAVLYVALCRELGLAARFVSGYCLADEAEEDELHAWAEVYVPGGGWRGYDPSTGLAVSDRHLAVAAGPTAADAAPVSGTFRGEARAEPLQTSLTIQRIS